MTKITKTVTIPQATAKLNIALDELKELPQGASFQSKQGNATATATMAGDGTIEISANCDSLTLLVDELITEVYHYQESNKALKTQLNKKEIIGLSSWQNFQIWCGRIAFGALIIIAVVKKIKSKIKTKWQKN